MSTESLDSHRVVEQAPRVVEDEPAPTVHVTSLTERGSFVVSECTCGWRSYARRSRPLARREGQDHERLHAPTV